MMAKAKTGELSEIHLSLMSGLGLKTNDRLWIRSRADASHVEAELGEAARVTRGLDLVEEPYGRKRRITLQSSIDERLKASSLEGRLLRTGEGGPEVSTFRSTAHRRSSD